MKKSIKEFNLASILALSFMILAHLMYAVYNFSNNTTFYIIDFLGSLFSAPVFMFILGSNISLNNKSSNELFKKGLFIFIISILFNIMVHSLPFYILSSVNKSAYFLTYALHWICSCDILTSIGLTFILMSLFKKINANNYTLAFIAICLSILNTLFTEYFPINFESNPLLATFTSMFYSSSITGYFSIFGWFIFPVAGKIYMDERIKHKDSIKFHLNCLIIGTIVYAIMFYFHSFLVDSKLIFNINDEYVFYRMHVYSGIMNVFFVLIWITGLHYIVKIIPNKISIIMDKINNNLLFLYIIESFLINYVFTLLFNNSLSLNTILLLVSFIIMVIVSNIILILYKKCKK